MSEETQEHPTRKESVQKEKDDSIEYWINLFQIGLISKEQFLESLKLPIDKFHQIGCSL